jgi:hypothetical protein
MKIETSKTKSVINMKTNVSFIVVRSGKLQTSFTGPGIHAEWI